MNQESPIDHAQLALDALYQNLLTTGEKTSAERIYQACEKLASEGVKKITAAAVGQSCEKNPEWGGPRAQSISNKKETLGALVKAWDNLHQLRRGRAVKPSHRRDSIHIDDPGAAAYLQVIESELKETRRAYQRVSEAFRNMQPVQIGLDPGTTLPSQYNLAPPTLSQVERDSVEAFLRKEHLADFGLEVDGRGRILDGRRVLMEGPVVSLLLRLCGKSQFS